MIHKRVNRKIAVMALFISVFIQNVYALDSTEPKTIILVNEYIDNELQPASTVSSRVS